MVHSNLTQGHVEGMVSTEKSSIHLWVQHPMAMLGMEIPQEPNPGLTSELAAKQARRIRIFHLRNVPDVYISALCCALPNLPHWGEEKCRGEQLFVVCISFYSSV